MFYNLRQTVNRAWFGFWAEGILKTPPLDIRDEGLVIFSLISHRDVMMYLVAIKSFYNHLRRGRIMILNDGSLTSSDMALLKAHVRPSAIIHIADVRTAPCPKGSCWERLLCIADLVCDSYVIQLDADSLALGPMPEVEAHIDGQKSFAIGQEYLGQEIYTMSYVSSEMNKKASEYVEVVAERNFDKLDEFENLKYSKSNACFTGFAKDSFNRKTVEVFSTKMESIIGKRWHEWGTEKITSNYVIANTPGATILPYPKYVSYYTNPEIEYERCSYLHFTGTHRFMNGLYIKMARKTIKQLKPRENELCEVEFLPKKQIRVTGDISVSAGRAASQIHWYKFAASFCKGKDVLDVGCGLGLGLKILAETARYAYGIDLDERLASENIKIMNICAVPDKSVDVVTAIDVIEHIEDDKAFVNQLCRIARVGVIVTTPNWTASRCRWPYHVREYMPEELVRLFSAKGKIQLFKGTCSGDKIFRVDDVLVYSQFCRLRVFPLTAFFARCCNRLFFPAKKIHSSLCVYLLLEGHVNG